MPSRDCDNIEDGVNIIKEQVTTMMMTTVTVTVRNTI